MGISLCFHKIIGYFCVIKSKSIKKTAKIVGFSIAGIILFFALLYILLQNSSIQNRIAKIAVSELSAKLHTKVSIAAIDYEFFNVLSLRDIYVEDQHKDTLIFVHQANAHFDFWKFFQGKIIFTSVDLDQLHGNLTINKQGKSNIDFVIEAFRKPQTTDTSKVEYHFKHFRLKNCSFNYTNLQYFKKTAQGTLNANKLRFNAINADIALGIFKSDSLKAEIFQLSAIEQSGFRLTDLKTQIFGSKTAINIPSLNVILPNSNLQLEKISLKYDSLADLKKLTQKVRWSAPINLSSIALVDLKAFVPEFKNTKGAVTLKGLLSGRISSMRFQKMEIKYGKAIALKADVDINGLPNLSEAFIYGQINELNLQPTEIQDFISEITAKPFVLPKELNQLGLLKYKGNITGFLSNLVAYGNLNTQLGSISTDILLKLENEFKDISYNGTVKTSNFQLGKLLNNNQLGKVAFNLNTKGSKKSTKALQGIITAKVPEFQLNSYSYRDITFDGKYDGKGFNGKAAVEDDNIHAHFNGIIDLTKKLPVLNFDLKVQNTDLNALHIINSYPGAKISFNGKTNLVGNSLDNINGDIKFDSITLLNQNRKLNMEQIQLISSIDKGFTHVNVISDYLNGTVSGNFKYSTIGLTVTKIIQNYLPSLSTTAKAKGANPNHVIIDLDIENTKEISDILALPYTLGGVTTIKGFIDENTNRIDLFGNIPSLKSSKQFLQNITLHCQNSKQKLQLTSRALLHEKDGLLNLFMTASAAKDSVYAQLGWQNSQKITNAGEIKVVAGFRKEGAKTAAELLILPTQIIVSDSIWDIHASSIDFNADSTIQVHDFKFDSRHQFIHVNGIASKNQNDSLEVKMNDLSLDFILGGLLKLKSIDIGGKISGKATLFSLLKQPIYQADLSVKKVTLNKKAIGDANIHSSWDKINSQVLANAIFVDDNKKLLATAGGVFVPKTDSLDFTFDTHRLSIEFLDRYFQSVVQNFKGFASGKIRMFGPSKILGFEGNALVTGGQASIKMLKTTYFFDDSVHLTRKSIHLRNIKVYDQERNPGLLSGTINHNGIFQQMLFDVNVTGRNILALNTQAQDNDYFFGKAYANGTVHIFGNEKVANIWVNAISQPKTKCYINMGGASTASDNSFINFVNKRLNTHKDSISPKAAPSSMNVRVNLQIDVTPDAEMELIVDPKGGDIITGRGNGNLRVEFDTFSDIKLFGTYTIDNGYYLFTLQNLIRKEFKVDKGSTLAWTGDPYNAQVNIRALYPLSASLKDLDQTLLTQNRSSVPVNCVLKLNDNLMKPTINFDIDLPQCDESVKQRVRSIVNTEEMMNRQILYLLVFNKFYTPEYLQNTASTANSIVPNEAISFGLSTLSAQVNSWISHASNNLTVGFDYKPSDKVNTEYQVQTQLLYQPNNRLIINGNFGYSNENANSSTNNNKFIGDVDVEYLLTQSGKLRLKAYNHTVDRYRLTTAKTTQGVGFLYKEDFNSVGDMFKYYWKVLTTIGKKKQDEDIRTK